MKKPAHRSTSAPVVASGAIFAKEHEGVAPFLSAPPPSPSRRTPASGRIAHIVSQIVDGGHAPSRLLRTLLRHHTQPVYLLSTEAHVFRPDEPQPYLSEPSWIRGGRTLAGLPRLWLEEEFSTHAATARRVARQLKAWEIDVALFHGCHPLQLYTAQICDVPHKVFFDHGGLPPEGIFDQIISSRPIDRPERVDVIPFVVTVQSPGRPPACGGHGPCARSFLTQGNGPGLVAIEHKDRTRTAHGNNQGTEQLPFVVEPTQGEATREPLLTTVSNHLDRRLAPAMQRAICEILERCPSAHYIALGETQLQPFHPRVHLPGPCASPAEHMGQMRVYLNEFPHGSGLALLDAMGAGVPVVALQGEGPPQAHYGADYFGRPVPTLDTYVDTAVKLLQDDAMHAEWSAHARAQFAKRGTPADYVRAIESAVPSLGSVSPPALR